MDVKSGRGYPASALSNFAYHPFIIDGVLCNSMEGFLQSLKFSNPEMQKYVCTLSGKTAKLEGKKKKWYRTQTLYWQGISIKRDSKEYQVLLDRAYMELYKNEKFRAALKATGNATITHSIGKRKQNETILTCQEFCSRLMKLRDNNGIL